MKAIQAIWKNGRIIPEEPLDWPEGTSLSIQAVEIPGEGESVPESDLLGNDPESIARWLAAYEALPTSPMTDAEEAEWKAARQAMKEYTIAKMQASSFEDSP